MNFETKFKITMNKAGGTVRFDIHTHILPAVDDGARNTDSTMRMLQIAAVSGTTHIVATPHFVCEITGNQLEEIRNKYDCVREEWKSLSEKNEMYLGNELMYGEGLLEALDKGKALTMNGTRYILVEFPLYSSFSYIRTAVQTLSYAGYWPILAHIERYECLRKMEYIKELIRLGAYMQINADSILGSNGYIVKYRTLKLVKSSMVHFVASDAHGSRNRCPNLKLCESYLRRKVGAEMTCNLFQINPEKMLRGELIDE